MNKSENLLRFQKIEQDSNERILGVIHRSSLNHGSFFVSDSVPVVFDVPVLSVTSGHVHGSDVVRVTETRRKSSSDGVEVMRIPAPFGQLNTVAIFEDGGSESVSHSDSFFLSVLNRGCSVPIPGEDVVIKLVEEVNEENVAEPHAERTVTVNSVFLEVSVHFVRVCI